MKTHRVVQVVCLTSDRSARHSEPICPVKGCRSDNACDPDAQQLDQPDDLGCCDFTNTYTQERF